MASQSLVSLEDGLAEVRDLQQANPSPSKGFPSDVSVSRAIGRASVVILSSHLEGYIYSLNVEAASAVNAVPPTADRLPDPLRLLHSRDPLDVIFETSWEGAQRAQNLSRFMTTDGWLWSSNVSGQLDPDRLVTWMKSPAPKALARYFGYWGIPDIFGQITRAKHTRDQLWVGLKDLVEKRNAIAHGDLATAATTAEVRSYIRVVERFAKRADGVLARQLARLCGTPRPW